MQVQFEKLIILIVSKLINNIKSLLFILSKKCLISKKLSKFENLILVNFCELVKS